jgi:hypothetical protein
MLICSNRSNPWNKNSVLHRGAKLAVQYIFTIANEFRQKTELTPLEKRNQFVDGILITA